MRFTDPLYLLLIVPVAAGLWFSFRHVHGMMRGRKWLAFALRAVLAACLVIALAGPQARRPNEGLCVIFLVDRSDSIHERDKERSLELVNQALKALGPKDRAAVVAFGSDARIDAAPSRLRRLPRILTTVDGAGTDLAGAVRLASATFPDGRARRIVLLTDGNETKGDLMEAASVAAAEQIEIDHVALGLDEREAEAAVVRAEMPKDVRLGAPFTIRVIVDSTVETDGLLTLDRNGVFVEQISVHLTRGKNSLVMTQTLDEPGFHRYRATLILNDDTDNRNNVGMGFVVVRGRPKVLVLQETPDSSPLPEALREQGIVVDLVGPDGLPARPEALQAYDAVILNDVNAAYFAASQMKLLESAVKDSGMGMAMIGGENSFLPGGYYGTPIADALPVDLDIRQRKTFPSTSVLIVVDASGSMGMIEDGVEKIRLAARAAEETVKLMGPQDRIGTAGSTDGIEFVAPMQTVGNKTRVISQIRKLSTGGGGIYIRPSMVFARAELTKEKSKVRHLILLADGADCDLQDGGIEIARQMFAAKITCSVVAIGDGKDVPFLKRLARAGGGRFYLATRAAQLPALFTQDAAIMSRSAIEEHVFLPKVLPGEEVLRGIPSSSIPALYAYCLVEDRPLAQTGMRTDRDEPLLASWQYGLGRTLAFTSDAQPRWAAQWVGWGQFGRFWAQATRSISRRATLNRYEASVTHDGAKGVLEISAFDRFGNPIEFVGAEVRVASPGGGSQKVNLTQQAPGLFRGEFNAREIGTYVVTVAEDSPGGGKRVSTSGFAVAYPAEYGRYRANRPLLEGVSRISGGMALRNPIDALRPAVRPGFSTASLWPLFVMFAAVLLLFDVAARRVALPVGEIIAKALAWLRSRRLRVRAPIPEVQAVGRLRRAKQRVRRQETGEKPQPVASTPASPVPEVETDARKPKPAGGGDQSAASRLLDAKRKRKNKG
ncbi:MAG: VWA domain-containing protein [Armatimonadetes bacterium]|nr:VWA domain-containing protein [Armatimonadota bacterium]